MSKDTDAPKPKRKDTDPPTEEELQQIWEEYQKKGWKKKTRKKSLEEQQAEVEVAVHEVVNNSISFGVIAAGLSGNTTYQ